MDRPQPERRLNVMPLVLSGLAILLSAMAWSRVRDAQEPTADTMDPATEIALDSDEPDAPVTDQYSNEATVSQLAVQPRSLRLPARAAPVDLERLEDEAERIVDRLLKVFPSSAVSYHINAMLNAQLHRTEQAAELWKRSIELAPEEEPYYVNLATLDLERGESASALDTLNRAVAAGLETPDILYHRGLALLRLGQLEEAIATIQTVVDAEQATPAHWLVLAQAQLSHGQTELAEENFRKAIELGAENQTAYFGLFNACLRNGKRDEAMKYREIYLSFSPDRERRAPASERVETLSESDARQLCVYLFSEAALLYSANDMHVDAEQLLLRAFALAPQDPNVVRQLADYLGEQQRYADEALVRRQLLALTEASPIDHLRLAKALQRSGRLRQAEAVLRMLIARRPTTVAGYAAMAEFLLESERAAEAEWFARKAISIDDQPAGQALLARVYRALGKDEEANELESLADPNQNSTPNGE